MKPTRVVGTVLLALLSLTEGRAVPQLIDDVMGLPIPSGKTSNETVKILPVPEGKARDNETAEILPIDTKAQVAAPTLNTASFGE